MKTRPRTLTTISFIGLIIIGMCWGCAGVEQKFDDWQSVIREKLNFEKSEAFVIMHLRARVPEHIEIATGKRVIVHR